jgi:hypothetical protein
MREHYFGDSYDIVKRFLLQSLAPAKEWAVLPMFTHEVSPNFVPEYETFLQARVASADLLTASADRTSYFAASALGKHVFLDPDTGIRLEPLRRSNAASYVLASEVVELCVHDPERLVVVFDQSLPRSGTKYAICKKLAYFHQKGLSGFAYVSHSCFVVLSAGAAGCSAARANLIATGLPSDRILMPDNCPHPSWWVWAVGEDMAASFALAEHPDCYLHGCPCGHQTEQASSHGRPPSTRAPSLS